MRRILGNGSAAIAITRIIAEHEPRYLIYAVPQVVLNAVLPLLYVYFPKLIIQGLVQGGAFIHVVRVILLYAAILLTINISNTYLSGKRSLSDEAFSRKLKGAIGGTAMELELKDVESASFRDIVQMANNAAGITGTAKLAQDILSGAIAIAGLAYVLIRLDWLFIMLVAATLTVKVIFVRFQYSYAGKRRLLFAKNDRLGNYLTDLCYFNNGGAKEIRLNNVQDWLMGKITGYRNEMVAMQLKDYRLSTIFDVIAAAVMGIQSFVILWTLSERYIGGIISIADFTMYFSAVAAITASLSRITEQIGDYNRQILNVSDYRKLVDLRNSECGRSSVAGSFDIPNKTEFVFKDVSFSYPNISAQVLVNIDITINDKEKLVVVGPNGAGKSTFVKLLCKFYRPTSGQILLNGTDIWDIPNDDYYKLISAVFQDFTNLAFSLKENVSMAEEADAERVRHVVGEVGLDGCLDELPNGLDTYISTQFDDEGVELSGGQGQKIAIARALYRNAPVLILDEPTASLDPKAESEIYADFFQASEDRTTIFISHRLAASTIADTIAVFSSGRIIEYGPHAALMEHNGVYAEMYRKQSRSYGFDT